MSRSSLFAVAGSCAVAATLAVGWWGLLLVGVVLGLSARSGARPGWTGAGAGASAWAVLLAWNATQGPVGSLAEIAGGSLGLPSVAFFLITLLFAAAVVGLSASVAGGLRRAAMTPPGRASNV
jgi:hypothetical protein